MTNQTRKRKLTRKRLIIIVISLLIALYILFISIDSLISTLNPFRGEGKKQAKPIYEATMEGITGTRLSRVGISSEKTVTVYFSQ